MSLFRHFMSNSKSRSSGGCWTCRVRRKKCAENRPVCDTCSALEITCYFQDERPEWMDGGRRQKEMGEMIKAQVKRQAGQRRDRRYLEMLEAQTQEISLGRADPEPFPLDRKMAEKDAPADPPDPYPSPGSHELSSNTNGSSPPPPPAEQPWHDQLFARHVNPTAVPVRESDLHFLMIYLDYVFPHLFPHYQPQVLAGGRGWVLNVLQSNKSVYHTAVLLASTFFAIVLANGEQQHEHCVARIVNRLDLQLELGIKELQKEMAAINASGPPHFDKNRALVTMQSITQMLFFELATSNKDNWRLHLDGAIALFVQILPRPEEWTETLESLYSPRWPPPEIGPRRPWSANQAALRFFTATLLYIDVLSSVTMGNAPRLYRYHQGVLAGCATKNPGPGPARPGPLFLEEFFGLPNWTIQALGDVAALDSWKRVQKQKGTFCSAELCSKAQSLSNLIKAGIEGLEMALTADTDTDTRQGCPMLVSNPMGDAKPQEQRIYQQIWLLAILSYLHVVRCGWTPSEPAIRQPVSRATHLLSQLPKGPHLRALSWPLCVAGCLSPREDEEAYRAVTRRMGPLQEFGTMKDAMRVMERVWSVRDQLDETWDISKCLKIFGHGVLLI